MIPAPTVAGTDAPLQVRVTAAAFPTAGEVVSLTVPPGAIHLFDAGTGRRLHS